jgi:magnesium transporter
MLDSGRNALLALDVKVSMATLGIGSGALMAGLFGMNLTSGLEATPYAFVTVTGTTAVGALLVYLYSSRVLKKVRHVALVGRPTSLPQSVRDAKQRFVRERAERERAMEAAACAAEAAAALGQPAANTTPIPDYETRWGEVRSSLKSRQSLWDRMFRPHSIRRTLLGMRASSPPQPKVTPADSRRNPIPPSPHAVPSSPTRAPTRPTPPRIESPSLGRSHSVKQSDKEQ